MALTNPQVNRKVDINLLDFLTTSLLGSHFKHLKKLEKNSLSFILSKSRDFFYFKFTTFHDFFLFYFQKYCL